jgi:hypothetical protein
MAVKLSALCSGRSLSPERFLVVISFTGWVDSRTIVRLEGVDQFKNSTISSGIKPDIFRPLGIINMTVMIISAWVQSWGRMERQTSVPLISTIFSKENRRYVVRKRHINTWNIVLHLATSMQLTHFLSVCLFVCLFAVYLTTLSAPQAMLTPNGWRIAKDVDGNTVACGGSETRERLWRLSHSGILHGSWDISSPTFRSNLLTSYSVWKGKLTSWSLTGNFLGI